MKGGWSSLPTTPPLPCASAATRRAPPPSTASCAACKQRRAWHAAPSRERNQDRFTVGGASGSRLPGSCRSRAFTPGGISPLPAWSGLRPFSPSLRRDAACSQSALARSRARWLSAAFSFSSRSSRPWRRSSAGSFDVSCLLCFMTPPVRWAAIAANARSARNFRSRTDFGGQGPRGPEPRPRRRRHLVTTAGACRKCVAPVRCRTGHGSVRDGPANAFAVPACPLYTALHSGTPALQEYPDAIHDPTRRSDCAALRVRRRHPGAAARNRRAYRQGP
ncbi:hypothetical protein CBM2595_A30379 [Cupriavidus taiwanensis]|nr:hypothetical protein CBM2595_A30379 [Cupriavidus taiwanensis]